MRLDNKFRNSNKRIMELVDKIVEILNNNYKSHNDQSP